ncbi:MAG: EF-P lysine aminoacylase EpmA [Pirellulaceae bacterium]
MTADDSSFRSTAPWQNLFLRAQLLVRLRTFFQQRGYIEVETPLLSSDTVVDCHLDPFAVTAYSDPTKPHDGATYWLQTSPEFGMKRLLADWIVDADRHSSLPSDLAIFQVTKAFRAAEVGSQHNPEFTMVEWYKQNESYQDAMQFLSQLSEQLLALGPAQLTSYRDAFHNALGISNVHTASVAELQQAASLRKLDIPESLRTADKDSWLNLLMAMVVEPTLGRIAPTILFDYPASQAALAQLHTDESGTTVAARFELYVQGIELANGYFELLDPDELERRNHAANQIRQSEGRFTLPARSRLIDAMRSGLPNCSGVALGFDRIVMIAAGASHIQQVIPFPWQRA